VIGSTERGRCERLVGSKEKSAARVVAISSPLSIDWTACHATENLYNEITNNETKKRKSKKRTEPISIANDDL